MEALRELAALSLLSDGVKKDLKRILQVKGLDDFIRKSAKEYELSEDEVRKLILKNKFLLSIAFILA